MTSVTEIGRKPEKSSFSLTCNLLSKYIKKKGYPADLGLGLPFDPAAAGKREAYKSSTTISLLPSISVRNATRSMDPLAPTNEPEKAQLTIFYDGKVLVFDNFPAEKAEDLMQYACKSSCTAAGAQCFSFMPSNSLSVVDHQSCPAPANSPAIFPSLPQPNFSDVPIARKASLHRFLEKRKRRISAKAPYQMSSSNVMKEVAASKEGDMRQPWLGLGPQISSR